MCFVLYFIGLMIMNLLIKLHFASQEIIIKESIMKYIYSAIFEQWPALMH